VQWKPNWSRQIHTPSALKDFYGRATVLGCVNEVLRSRVRRKIEWNRREFMSCNFRVRIEHPDGSVTSEVMPYPDVKRRFPAALFEFMENRMPPPRVPEKDEPRRDGLLPVYNNINIPRCLYLNKGVTKAEKKAEMEATTDIQNSSTNDVGNLPAAKQEVSPSRSPKDRLALAQEAAVKVKGGKKQSAYRRFGKRIKRRRNRSLKISRNSEESSSTSVQKPLNEVSNATELETKNAQMKITMPPGISTACAEEFLQKVRSTRRSGATSSQKTAKSSSISSKRPNGKRQSMPTNTDDEDIVVIAEITPGSAGSRSRLSLSSSRSSRSASTPKSSVRTRLNGKKSPATKENHSGTNVHTDSKSQQRTMSVKRRRRSSNDGKSLSCKRSTPLRPRNSLENYFNCSVRKTREVLGNAANQQNISAR
ncbi:hypothetical protein OSTOST_05406, partial [Ostertagia ostertagi]